MSRTYKQGYGLARKGHGNAVNVLSMNYFRRIIPVLIANGEATHLSNGWMLWVLHCKVTK